MRIYPNPNSDRRLNIRLENWDPAENEVLQIRLIDLSGRAVLQTSRNLG